MFLFPQRNSGISCRRNASRRFGPCHVEWELRRPVRQAFRETPGTRRPSWELEGMSVPSRACQRAAILAALLFVVRPAHATIDYTVSLSHPERHVFAVKMRIPNVRDQVTLQLPAWNALYQIRDFASHMMQV